MPTPAQPSDLYARHITWVEHKGAGKTVNVEVGTTVVGGQIRWYANLVLAKSERLALPGGKVPAGARLADLAIEQAVRRQVQGVDAQRLLQGLQQPQAGVGRLFEG
jgi:hypothetical protein